MKKNILLTLFVLLSVSACNSNKNSSNSLNETQTKNVIFDLNYDVENDTYLNLTIFDGQTLSEPKEPNRRDYVFNGWYIDEACETKFEGFNETIKDNLTLYASWTPFNELRDDVKLDRFINKVKELSGNVGKAIVEIEGLETYYSPMEGSYPFYQEMEYNRYKDITTVDYYTENRESKFIEQQYFYDDEYFYNIFKDIENDGKDSYKETARFMEQKINSHLDIDFMNLYGSLLTSLSNQIKKGHSYDEMDYSFTINDTHIDEYSESYECELNYYTYTESADFGSVEEIYMMEFGFTFVNGKIKRSRVVQQYMFGIQSEVQSVIENNIYTTYETVDEYQDFDGIRFNPEDFQYKKTDLIR